VNAMYHLILWKWNQHNAREIYTAEHVNKMVSMLNRNCRGLRYRIVCITDDPSGIHACETFPLWHDAAEMHNATNKTLPSCYRRLRLYDPKAQSDLGMRPGERVASIDLDALVTGQLAPLLSMPGRFVGWELPGTHHPRVFNGSFQMFSAGTLNHIWEDFDGERSALEANKAGYRGSDQAWLSYRLINEPDSVGVAYPMISSYPLQTKIRGHHSAETLLVFYHGRLKPWHDEAKRKSNLTQQFWR